MITTSQISPGRLSAGGYGEYRPVASNSTRESRRLNRRVDIVILSTVVPVPEPKANPETDPSAEVEQSARLGEAEPIGQASSLPSGQ